MESSKQPPGDPARDVANSIAIVLALFLVPFLVLITVMKAFECFPKKVKTLKTIAIESVLKPESKQKKKFSGLKKNQQIVCFAETFALFSQRVYPNHVFFIF